MTIVCGAFVWAVVTRQQLTGTRCPIPVTARRALTVAALGSLWEVGERTHSEAGRRGSDPGGPAPGPGVSLHGSEAPLENEDGHMGFFSGSLATEHP